MDNGALRRNNDALRWLVEELAHDTTGYDTRVTGLVDLIKRRVDNFDELINN